MARLFLSYSWDDKALARRIAQDLSAAGVDVWFDEWKVIKAGDSIVQAAQKGLESADFVAVLLTRSSVRSGWVEKEWQSRIGEEAASRRVIVLPLRGGDCQIPVLLRDKCCPDFTQDYARALRMVLEAIEKRNEIGHRCEDDSETQTDSRLKPPAMGLRIFKETQESRDVWFRQANVLIGRNADCDLALGDEKKVSRRHAVITYAQGRYWLRDLESKNRTFLYSGKDAVELDERPVALEPGTRLRLGTVLEIEVLLPEAL